MGAINKEQDLGRLSPQDQLLESLLEGQLDRFKTLLHDPSVQPTYKYKNVLGQYGSCLEIASRHDDKTPFVATLLPIVPASNFHCNPSPLHYAARIGNSHTLQLLLEDGRTHVNAATNIGWTALHFITIHCDLENPQRFETCTRLLLSHPHINVNVPNKKGYTPIHQAAIRKNRNLVELMLEQAWDKLDLDNFTARGRTARDTIRSEFPDMAVNLPPPRKLLN